MIKRILWVILALIAVLVAILVFNAVTFKSKQLAIAALPAPAVPPTALEHLQEAIRFKTISFNDSTLLDTTQFFGFHRFLEKTYPAVHVNLVREKIKKYSLLYCWKGNNPSLNPRSCPRKITGSHPRCSAR